MLNASDYQDVGLIMSNYEEDRFNTEFDIAQDIPLSNRTSYMLDFSKLKEDSEQQLYATLIEVDPPQMTTGKALFAIAIFLATFGFILWVLVKIGVV